MKFFQNCIHQRYKALNVTSSFCWKCVQTTQAITNDTLIGQHYYLMKLVMVSKFQLQSTNQPIIHFDYSFKEGNYYTTVPQISLIAIFYHRSVFLSFFQDMKEKKFSEVKSNNSTYDTKSNRLEPKWKHITNRIYYKLLQV